MPIPGLPNWSLGLARAAGRVYTAIGPHELLSGHSCPDWQLQEIRASTTVGGFPRHISVLPGRDG